eukprot:CAMPEP_0171325644 /NCGR_PEP_ID=MMETSP0816-20121228/116941_1 /TAXON_ID=420281 /ORGANISM="Proboscia inermis, Strain CCAP1064/1" /LENGTH=235 /DNA_ID=CAMNT_0011824875 /DNA_START=149 /DNA_END=856 /DNA_ORIENTATION=-
MPNLTKISTKFGLDQNGEPSFGIIFGSLMSCTALGGIFSPLVRKALSAIVTLPSSLVKTSSGNDEDDLLTVMPEEKPVALELLNSLCLAVSSVILLLPQIVGENSAHAFSLSLGVFFMYEFLVGIYMPCEGILRTIYIPNADICSIMTMLRMVVNIAVAVGVFSLNFISLNAAFRGCSLALATASVLQLSLVNGKEWSSLRIKTSHAISRFSKPFNVAHQTKNKELLDKMCTLGT